jgi:predicted PurR-regulated permease PerM
MWPGGSPTAVNGAAGLTIVALIIAALYVGRDLLIPLALAGILSFILAPLLRRLTDWGMPRGLAVAVVIAAMVAALAGGITLAGREVAQLVEEVPRHESTLRDKARFMHSFSARPESGSVRPRRFAMSNRKCGIRKPKPSRSRSRLRQIPIGR